MNLRYGCNPHQIPAQVYSKSGALPFRVLNGKPSYINFLDALNSWQLVKELKETLNLPAAASFKHVSPAGAAVGVPLTDSLHQAYFVGELELSEQATAYARARGADRMSSYGDWVALSDVVDVPTAKLLRREVSDGIIAPGYDEQALDILRRKKGGKYRILEIDPDYIPPELETREIFGITLEQRRNDYCIDSTLLQNVVTRTSHISKASKRDLLVAYITLKYTQSNSVCFAYDGQTIGVGAGQQSRIHCTRLAGAKAQTWFLRQHPKILKLLPKSEVNRPTVDTAIDHLLQEEWLPENEVTIHNIFVNPTEQPSQTERREWLGNMQNIALGSDGYIPFRDNIDTAHRFGVSTIIQPGSSIQDENIIQACDEYGIAMVFTNLRLFHH